MTTREESPKEMPGGYQGKILRVNLTDGKIAAENIDDSFCRKYLGGSGFIAYYLLKEMKKGVDPLGPDNKLVFALGPITGTPMIGAGRNAVGAKSPLGGSIALAEVGEFWGAELKHAGYDAIIVEGKAVKPVYLWIKNGEAVIKDAAYLWGRNTKETQAEIRSDLGDSKVRVAMIGPGGENLVRFANIMNGCYDAAGRGGLGAVMGSKNLKAVAVRGSQPPRVADPERLKTIVKKAAAALETKPMARVLSDTGTGGPVMMVQEQEGNLPVCNFRDGLFPGVAKIHAGVIRDTIRVGMDACYTCPVRCKKRVKVEETYVVDPAYGGPEYETLAALGSDCGVDDLKAIAKGSELCNANSLDTISTGSTIAFAMECFEKGLLTEEDTGGIDLSFGNADAVLECIRLIARREGIGDRLANGSAWLAEQLGNNSKDFAMQVKGVDAGQHEPRLKPGLGLGFMIDPTGADHVLNMIQPFNSEVFMKPLHPMGMHEVFPVDDMSPGKVAIFKLDHLKTEIANCLVMCVFMAPGYESVAELVETVTGWDTGVMELLRIAERVLTMARTFNVREGFTDSDDELPRRFYQPKTDGALSDKPLDPVTMDRAKRYYYTLMGWDARTGVPLPGKLEELGIADL